jgi:hypothetical protein
MQLLTGHNNLVQGARVIDMPLCVETEMSDVGHVLVAILLDLHLLDCVRPRVEVYLTALVVEGKVADFD